MGVLVLVSSLMLFFPSPFRENHIAHNFNKRSRVEHLVAEVDKIKAEAEADKHPCKGQLSVCNQSRVLVLR